MRPGARWTAGAVLAAVAIVAALLAGPLTTDGPRHRATNLYPNVGPAIALDPGDEACQDGETIPSGARSILLQPFVAAPFNNGGPLEVTLRQDGAEIDRTRIDGPFRNEPVSGAIAPPPRDVDGVEICMRNAGPGPVALGGFPARPGSDRDPRFRYLATPVSVDGRPQIGRATIEFPLGERTPLQMAGRIAERNDLFRSDAVQGWSFWGALVLLVLAAAAGIAAVVRGGRRAQLLVAVAAVGSAIAWALLTPTFQVPDELPHYGHAGYIAETGDRPGAVAFQWVSNEEMEQIEYGMPWGYVTDPFWTQAADDRVSEALERDLDRTHPGQAGFTNNVPPLYYLYEAIPYTAAASGTLLDRLLAMRVWSALLAGLLAALVFAFVREVLPSAPLAAGAGALAVGLHPLVGHIAGGVSPDPLLWVWSAAIFVLLARLLRRGPSVRLGVVLGLVACAGLLTKPAMATLAPGVVCALSLLLLRARGERRRALLTVAAAGAAVLVPFVAWQLLSPVLFGSAPTVGAGFASTETRNQPLMLREFISYLWQFHLPRLPFQQDLFPDAFPLWEIYFKGWTGRFGWFQYDFGNRTETIALIATLGLVAFAAVTLIRLRARLRGRWAEAFAYLALFAGCVVMVSAAGYRYRSDITISFEQTRYLFPALLPLYGLTVGLAVQALGRRRATALAAFVLTLLAGHALAAQLLTVERYYL